DEDAAPLPISREIAGEWSYNVATPGPRRRDLIRRLESARVFLNTENLLADVATMERARDKLRADLLALGVDDARLIALRTWQRAPAAVWALLEEYAEVAGQFNQFASVRDDVRRTVSAGGGQIINTRHYVLTKSRFYTGVNRRVYAGDFSPIEVSAKDPERE